MKKSKWYFWSFVPFINFAAWIHAAIRTGRNSYYWFVALYALPFTFALVLGMIQQSLGLSDQAVEKETDWGSTVAAILWIAGMIHALLKKDTVDQQIQAYDVGKMQAVLAAANPTAQLSGKIPVPRDEMPQLQSHEMASPTPACQPDASDLRRAETTPSVSSKVTKEGTILDYSIQNGEGTISGDDNNRYKFAGSEWRASGAPKRGQRVTFGVANARAIEVS